MPTSISKIGVLTSGGDAPGMNAAIRAVVRSCYHYKKFIAGIYRGYQGLVENDIVSLDVRSVSKILGRGGTMLKSARSNDFMTKEGRQKAYENIVANDIDALIVVGGDGTFTGANIFYKEHGIPIVGIPGTIDNDLYGTDYTIGFDTATNIVVDAIDKIRDTASSHNRLFFVEVMGRDSGFIALRSGLASGAIEVMLPETEISVEELIQLLNKARKNKKTSSIIVVAEGNENGNAMQLAEKIKAQDNDYDTRVTVLGHIQRGGAPSCLDRVLASKLGVASVEALLAGKKDVMVGNQGSNISYIPFSEAISKKKEINNYLLNISKILSL